MQDHSTLGYLLLRLALAAPVALLYWLIRRDLRKNPSPHGDDRENPGP